MINVNNREKEFIVDYSVRNASISRAIVFLRKSTRIASRAKSLSLYFHFMLYTHRWNVPGAQIFPFIGIPVALTDATALDR